MKNIFKYIITAIIKLEAKMILKKYQPKIVAVTGNVGKTSTKDAIYTVMSKTLYVRKSEKSFNSDIGVPLTILGCANAWSDPLKWLNNIWEGFTYIIYNKKYPEWLVLEVGADRPGDIKGISSWLKPNIVVVTRFSEVPVHIENFKSRADIITEKGYLVDALRHDGVLVLNSDDSDVYNYRKKFPGKLITYGMLGDAEVRASNYSVYYSEDIGQPVGVHFKVEHAGSCLPVLIKGTLGEGNVYLAIAAIAVGLSLNINIVDSTQSLLGFVPAKGRMNLISGINKSIIIDDTYNSAPVAMKSALETLGGIKTSGRRLAALGDMLELGRHTVEVHRKMGELAAASCDTLITVGLRARTLAESAIDAGLDADSVLQFDDSVEAAEYLKTIIKTGDTILVKGSQSIRMEKITAALLAEPEKAADLLVRQDEEWKKR
jgi:UDP-N-acetylmuramoyl-tripeptide--D-alanyl-D-alanine ligase